ncbi:DciA family protein [Sphingobium sp. HBC34]|uniref:DciA family protein n=1 Tax=Sphingobium cyanobacteriorum TaxID=3063954 RepID=A0ABT8ZNZ3_9SPHN|nr:DciA family protein [Sphingobium sp. HBC34]MDO7835926.1 DciA family protein [Sphingobium sp. HBC34]
MTERPVPPKMKSRKIPVEERPRVGASRRISDLMPDIGRAAFRKFGFVQSSIVTRWTEIVGAHYASVSAPESIRFPVGQKAGGTLQLTVLSGHAPMIQHVLPDIVERVNRFFGYAAVAKVAMRQGDIASVTAERRPPPRNLKPIPVELGDSLRDIGDPELRAVLESLAQGLANSSGLPKIN